MAFQKINNVEIVGLAACVPSEIEENISLSLFQSQVEYEKFVKLTGIERRRVGRKKICASDLCCHAAEKLIDELKWQKNEIDCLVFVSHGPDYKYPATSCIMQSRLGLSQECMSLDISLGCSGWVYGLSVISSIISASKFEKALLLVGDTASSTKSPTDRSTYPLFGDAGTATALSYSEDAKDLMTHMGTDGDNYNAILVEDGGSRNPVTVDSLKQVEYQPGIIRNRLQTHMDGMTVFSFGISRAPKSVNALLTKFGIDKNSIDFFIFHQANMMMNKVIQKKLNLPDEKTPYLLKDFGNTSSASIPLTLVTQLRGKINESTENHLNMLACGFGVGLSWGSVLFNLQNTLCCELIEF